MLVNAYNYIIFCQARNGDLEDQINSAILPTVLNAGILFLIRWAMDDSIESVVCMSIKTLRSIIMSDADEVIQLIFCLRKIIYMYLRCKCADDNRRLKVDGDHRTTSNN